MRNRTVINVRDFVESQLVVEFQIGITLRHRIAGNGDIASMLRDAPLRGSDRIVLLAIVATVVWIVWGITRRGYYLPELAAQFFALGLFSAVVILIARRGDAQRPSANRLAELFTAGVAQMVPVALVIGAAKGMLWLLGGTDPHKASVLNTLLYTMGDALEGWPPMLAAQGMLLFQAIFNFFVTSGSAQAAITMPLMAGLGDIVGVSRQVAVLAFQLGDGITNLVIPTSAVLMGALGVLLYYTAVRPFFGKPGLAWVMSTIGFGIIVQNIALAIWGPSPMVMPSPLGNDVIRIGGAGVLPQEILVLCISVTLMLCLDIIMRKTRLGKAVRAVAQNGPAAVLMGINVTAIIVLAFIVSSSLAGVAGLLIAPITTASVFMGLTLALKAFSAAIVGGLSNPRGCMLGGFLLGLLEAMVGLWQAELREISIFLLIIFVLVLKPEGLLGQRLVEKV